MSGDAKFSLKMSEKGVRKIMSTVGKTEGYSDKSNDAILADTYSMSQTLHSDSETMI